MVSVLRYGVGEVRTEGADRGGEDVEYGCERMRAGDKLQSTRRTLVKSYVLARNCGMEQESLHCTASYVAKDSRSCLAKRACGLAALRSGLEIKLGQCDQIGMALLASNSELHLSAVIPSSRHWSAYASNAALQAPLEHRKKPHKDLVPWSGDYQTSDTWSTPKGEVLVQHWHCMAFPSLVGQAGEASITPTIGRIITVVSGDDQANMGIMARYPDFTS